MRLWIPVVTLILASQSSAVASGRIVFPQAAVGPLGEDVFQIELHLGNRNPNSSWKGRISLLQQDKLEGFQDLQVTDDRGSAVSTDAGGWEVELPAGGSARYRVSSQTLQIGILLVETASALLQDLIPSFYYRLQNAQTGIATDLIAVQPAYDPALRYNTMLSKSATFNVGLALVADAGIDAAQSDQPIPTVQVTLTVDLTDGRSLSTVVGLGGVESAQKALFPQEFLTDLPEEYAAARLNITAAQPVYCTLLGVGSPPGFQDIQIGAAPALVETSYSFPLQDGWTLVPDGSDLLNDSYWECAGNSIREVQGGVIDQATANWTSVTNNSGPYLRVSGDFGVHLAVHAPSSGRVMLVGRPASGPEWWRGMRRLDVGVANGQMTALKWNDSPTSEWHGFLSPGTLSGRVQLEIIRQGTTFHFFHQGKEVGSLEDFGLTEDGVLYFGSTVAPGEYSTVYGIAAETPSAQAANVTVVQPAFEYQATPRADSLRAAAAARGLNFGAGGVRVAVFTEPYLEALGSEFGWLTPGNAMKWSLIHPERDRYTYCRADGLCDFAQANGMLVRGHTLVWHLQNPDWLKQGNFTRDELVAILRSHIFEVVTHYRGIVKEWDVVNEGVDTDGSLRPTLWLNGIGPEYIEMAFRWAREADPDARLFYNDYGADGINQKSDGIYRLLKDLLEKSVPIDGVGFQGHLALKPWGRVSKADVLANLKRFGELGLETNFTEVDVRIELPVTAEELEDQAEQYRILLEACLETESCHSFFTWGVGDADSWIPDHAPGYGAALLLDEDYQPKPAYRALLETLQNN